MGKLSQLRHGLTGKPVEKIFKKVTEAGIKFQPSPIRCVGSKAYPECRLPLFTSDADKKIRDTILYAFEVSRICPNGCVVRLSDFKYKMVGDTCPHCLTKLIDDPVDHQIYLEILDQCVFCMIEHPEVSKIYGARKVKMYRSARGLLSKM